MGFLYQRVFNSVIQSNDASETLKKELVIL